MLTVGVGCRGHVDGAALAPVRTFVGGHDALNLERAARAALGGLEHAHQLARAVIEVYEEAFQVRYHPHANPCSNKLLTGTSGHAVAPSRSTASDSDGRRRPRLPVVRRALHEDVLVVVRVLRRVVHLQRPVPPRQAHERFLEVEREYPGQLCTYVVPFNNGLPSPAASLLAQPPPQLMTGWIDIEKQGRRIVAFSRAIARPTPSRAARHIRARVRVTQSTHPKPILRRRRRALRNLAQEHPRPAPIARHARREPIKRRVPARVQIVVAERRDDVPVGELEEERVVQVARAARDLAERAERLPAVGRLRDGEDACRAGAHGVGREERAGGEAGEARVGSGGVGRDVDGRGVDVRDEAGAADEGGVRVRGVASRREVVRKGGER